MASTQISIRLSADEFERLQTLAWLNGKKSASALATEIIREILTSNAEKIKAAMALREATDIPAEPAK